MALQRGSGNRFNPTIWPGFVDAMTGLLLVLMFVLTIFTVVQFVLRDEISGQATKLTDLAAEVSALTQALGLEQMQTAELTTDLGVATDQAATQAALIDRLTGQRDTTALALVAAENRITGFEAQVAGLLADQVDARAQVAGLEAAQVALLSEQEALNLALATARGEIDASTEAARLAAARREALQALVAQLRREGDARGAQISDLEAAQLVDAAAAEALRARLTDASTELTAMTLALEEQRQQAEDTLTLLAAAEAGRDELNVTLAAALLARAQVEAELTTTQTARADLGVRLAAALTAGEVAAGDATAAEAALAAALRDNALSQQEIEGRLAAAVLAQQATETDRVDLQARLAEALLAQTALQEVSGRDRADLEGRLAAAMAAIVAAEQSGAAQLTQAEQQAALLAAANTTLSEEQALSADSLRQVALLNEQVTELRTQVGTLQVLLDVSADADSQSQVQIEALGSQLNTALARAASEERRARLLEEAERIRLQAETVRLAAEAQNLERYRSEFFGQLRDVLDGQDGVRIEGDRFVFSSEVLFQPGSATLSAAGAAEIAKVGAILQGVAGDIPDAINWVIRVDGHTDNLPLSGGGEFANNWELSQARALSVVLFMIESQGIAPDRLAANGFGEFQPLNPADTVEARAQNRRIEIKLTER